jgi:hypothetical protein
MKLTPGDDGDNVGPDNVRIEDKNCGGAHQRGEDDEDKDSIPVLPHLESIRVDR